MTGFSDTIIPLVMGGILLYGLVNKADIFGSFLDGAKDGLMVSLRILPALVALMTAVGMFRASGALDVFTWSLSPLASLLRLPQEVLPLALLRPISGSGSMAVLQDILHNYGPDSVVGRVASVMQGSTETTFYTIAVYYGATQVKQTRHTLPCALAGDLTGFIMSALMVRLLFHK